jgi:hypothetical protein
MMKLSASFLFACVCAGLLLACSPEAHSQGATEMPRWPSISTDPIRCSPTIGSADERISVDVSIRPRLVRRANGSY